MRTFQRKDFKSYTKLAGLDIKNLEHELIFAIKPLNMDKIDKILNDISDPTSPNYGNHLSSESVAKLSSNRVGYNAIRLFLKKSRVSIISETIYGDFIVAKATISKWEQMLSTTFYNYKHNDGIYPSVLRAEAYTIESNVQNHLSGIYNLVDFPVPMSFSGPTILNPDSSKATSFQYSDVIDPATLNYYYNITSNIGLPSITQAIYSSPISGNQAQFYSASDIKLFQKTYGIPNHPLDNDVNKRNYDSICVTTPALCTEANVDLEYVMAVARNTTTSLL